MAILKKIPRAAINQTDRTDQGRFGAGFQLDQLISVHDF